MISDCNKIQILNVYAWITTYQPYEQFKYCLKLTTESLGVVSNVKLKINVDVADRAATGIVLKTA